MQENQARFMLGSLASLDAQALRVLEALVAAGYRPTVWHNVPRPAFVGLGGIVADTLDPFCSYGPQPSPRSVGHMVARMH